MRLVLLGPPSAGKGTQASMLSTRFDLLHLATGDLLREAVANGSSLGKKAKKYMDTGALVPDAIVIGLLEGKMKSTQSQTGFVLDGFPRNLDQAKQLEEFTDIDLVLSIEVNPGLLLERATGRRVCRTCGAVYHLRFNPPKAPGVCDKDGGELYLRDDDNEEVVKKRLRTYEEQTKPIIQHYESTGKLKRIEGDGSIDEVQNRLLAAIVEQWPQLDGLAHGPIHKKAAAPASSRPAMQGPRPQAQAQGQRQQGGQQQGGGRRRKRHRGRHRGRYNGPGPRQQGNN